MSSVPITNASDKLLTMWDLYYCPNSVDFSTIPSLTNTNQSTVKTALDALSYTTVGHIKDFRVSHSKDSEDIIRAWNCGVWELARYAQITPSISFTWLDVNNRPAFDKMLWIDRLSVAAAPVTLTNQVFLASWTLAALQTVVIPYANGDGSDITITAIKNNTTTLVNNTDYKIVKIGNVTYFVANTVLTLTGIGLNITGSYTPSASTLDGYNIVKDALPYGVYKFVSCKSPIGSTNPATQAVQDTIYFWKFVVDGEVVEWYIDRVETEFAGADMSFVWAVWGWYLKSKATVAYP